MTDVRVAAIQRTRVSPHRALRGLITPAVLVLLAGCPLELEFHNPLDPKVHPEHLDGHIDDDALFDAILETGEDHLKEIKTLEASDSGIKSLEGIGYLPELEVLDVSDNEIANLSPLRQVGTLRNVDVGGNPLEEGLDALTELDELKWVDLTGTGIPEDEFDELKDELPEDAEILPEAPDDLDDREDPVQEMEGLDTDRIEDDDLEAAILNTGEDHVDDVEELEATDQDIRDLGGIEQLENLKELDLAGNRVSDVTPLAQMDLENLYLQDNNVSDVTPLAELDSLYTVNLEGNDASEVNLQLLAQRFEEEPEITDRDGEAIEVGDSGDLPQDPDEADGVFHTVWNTEEGGAASDDDQIALPLVYEDDGYQGRYDFMVDWGDGEDPFYISGEAYPDDPGLIYSYETPQEEVDVKIWGEIEGFSFGGTGSRRGGDENKLVEIEEWGPLAFGNAGEYFSGAENLTITAADTDDTPDLSGTEDMSSAFEGAHELDGIPNIGDWDMTAVTDASSMFRHAWSFDEDLGDWADDNGPFGEEDDINLESMFRGARAFEGGGLEDWDVSGVTDMTSMFLDAEEFDGDIGDWEVGQVTEMDRMFEGADSFDGDLSGWDVSGVTDMSSMFEGAQSFGDDDGEIEDWDVSKVKNMNRMFKGAQSSPEALAGDDGEGGIADWDVGSLKSAQEMFAGEDEYEGNVDLNENDTNNELYDDLLKGWAALGDEENGLQEEVEFHAGDSEYTDEAKHAQETLTDEYDWDITDAGYADDPND